MSGRPCKTFKIRFKKKYSQLNYYKLKEFSCTMYYVYIYILFEIWLGILYANVIGKINPQLCIFGFDLCIKKIYCRRNLKHVG